MRTRRRTWTSNCSGSFHLFLCKTRLSSLPTAHNQQRTRSHNAAWPTLTDSDNPIVYFQRNIVGTQDQQPFCPALRLIPSKSQKELEFFRIGDRSISTLQLWPSNFRTLCSSSSIWTRRYAAINFNHLHTGYLSNICGGILELSVDPTLTTVNPKNTTHDTGEVYLDTVRSRRLSW